MIRAVLLFAVLVLVPAFALSGYALRSANQEYEEAVAAWIDRLRTDTEALAARLQRGLDDAVERAEARVRTATLALRTGEPPPRGSIVALVRRGEASVYSLPRDDETQPSDEEQQLYELSVRGGEDYEFARTDPARALDAYAFYLARIRSPELRDRLRMRIARAAIAAGNDSLGDRVLEQLAATPTRSRTEEGLPVGVLAGLRLAERSTDETVERRVLLRILAHRHEIPTSVLAVALGALGADDSALARVVSERRTLETSLARHPEIGITPGEVLTDETVLVSRSVELPGGSYVRGVAIEELDWPTQLESFYGRAELTRDRPTDTEEFEPAVVSVPLRLPTSSEPVRWLTAIDPSFASSVLPALHHERLRKELLILLLLVATLCGGGALVVYLRRERRLALLRQRLLANVSHELKTPATSIRMFSEMLAEEDLPKEKSRRFAQLLHTESVRLSRVIENVLELSRLDRGQRKLRLETCDLQALVGRIAESFSWRAREQDVAFRIDAGPTGALHVRADPAAVERILANLLDNAIKYRSEESPSVELRLCADGGRALVTVSDNGPGIPPGDRKRIFQEFYRAGFLNYRVQGTGLGLAIARRLARALGGDLYLLSVEGKGSAFTLSLPLASEPSAESTTDKPPAEDAADAR